MGFATSRFQPVGKFPVVRKFSFKNAHFEVENRLFCGNLWQN